MIMKWASAYEVLTKLTHGNYSVTGAIFLHEGQAGALHEGFIPAFLFLHKIILKIKYLQTTKEPMVIYVLLCKLIVMFKFILYEFIMPVNTKWVLGTW